MQVQVLPVPIRELVRTDCISEVKPFSSLVPFLTGWGRGQPGSPAGGALAAVTQFPPAASEMREQTGHIIKGGAT